MGGRTKSSVFEEVIPSEEEKERINKVAEEEVASVKEFLRKHNAPFDDVVVAGSVPKGTFLRTERDIDIFIVTPEPTPVYSLLWTEQFRTNLRKKRGELRIWSYERDGIGVDLVVVEPEQEAVSTLRHTEFYSKQLTEEQKREVIRGKALFKTFGAYGAENGGITGVAVEELIRRHGDLYAACKKLLEGPFWLQDPVLDRPRNLLASVVEQKWKRIESACSSYLRNEPMKYRKYSGEDFAREMREKGFEVMEFENRKGDIGWGFSKALKNCEVSCRELKKYERDISCFCDAFSTRERIYVAFKTEPKHPGEKKLRCVDKRFGEEAVKRFKEAHPNWFERNSLVCAEVERRVKEPMEFVAETIRKIMRI